MFPNNHKRVHAIRRGASWAAMACFVAIGFATTGCVAPTPAENCEDFIANACAYTARCTSFAPANLETTCVSQLSAQIDCADAEAQDQGQIDACFTAFESGECTRRFSVPVFPPECMSLGSDG